MDVAYLREFVTLACHKKLSSASKALFMAPSTLSQHISALEKELGCALFSRSKGLELTREGEAVLERSQRIIFEYDAMLHDCAEAPGGVVRLSFPNYYYGMAPITASRQHFVASHRGCRVTITSNNLDAADPFEILADGSSDLSALNIARGCGKTVEDYLPEGVESVRIGAYRCLFFSLANHPLADVEVLTAADLDGATVLLRLCSANTILADQMQGLLAGYGVDVRYILRQMTRNVDVFSGNMGQAYMQWFEPVEGSFGPSHPPYPFHRFEHDIIADAYALYMPERLSELQLAYLDTVRRDVETRRAAWEKGQISDWLVARD